MSISMKLIMNPAPGAILRVIGLAERRGYDPLFLSAEHLGEKLVMYMTVRADRPIHIFVSHVQKMFGMNSVEVMS